MHVSAGELRMPLCFGCDLTLSLPAGHAVSMYTCANRFAVPCHIFPLFD